LNRDGYVYDRDKFAWRVEEYGNHNSMPFN
jgi:hypothetical protein